MPKNDVVFQASFSDTSEDEIQEIPVVKPPPIVIDLLESDAEEDVQADGSSKKSPRRKKKKKKREKERERRGDDSITDCASLDGENSPSMPVLDQPSVSEQNESTSSNVGKRGGKDSTCGQLNDELQTKSRSISNELPDMSSSSVNATEGSCSTSEQNKRSSPDEVLSSGLHFERCIDAQSKNQETEQVVPAMATGSTTGTEMIGSTPRKSSAPTPESQGNEKRSKARDKKTDDTPSRTRTTSLTATQRTNEEIVNFLTTIGISLDCNAFNTPSGKRKRAGKRNKNATDASSLVDPSFRNHADGPQPGNVANTINANQSTSLSGPGPFVSVSEETSSSQGSKLIQNKSPTRKRQRKAYHKDICDYEITNVDLNSVTTNILSNIKIPSDRSTNSPKPTSRNNENFVSISTSPKVQVPEAVINNYASTIDSVASGSYLTGTQCGETNSSIVSLPESNKSSAAPTPTKNIIVPTSVVSTDNAATGKKSQQQMSNIISESEESQSNREEKNTDTGTTLKSDPKPQSSMGCENEGTNKNKSKQWSPLPGTPTSSRSLSSSNHNRSRRNIEDVSISIPAGNTINVMETPAPPAMFCQSFNTEDCDFPATWTDQMKDFYGNNYNENFEHEDVWPTQSDAGRLWKSPIDLMPPPRSKRNFIRCDRCKQMGNHFARECKEKPKPFCCHMCGELGHSSYHHSRRSCPHAQCLNCGETLQHFSQQCSNCLLRRNPTRCDVCNVVGHNKGVCPDNWRRYHQVTSTEEYEKLQRQLHSEGSLKSRSRRQRSPTHLTSYKRSSSVYCSNCGKRGHSFYDCNGSRFNPYHRNKPFIIHEVPSTTTINTTSNLLTSNEPSPIPISYDPKSGRTVVLGTEKDMQTPTISVETIQVKIANDLATLERIQVKINNDLALQETSRKNSEETRKCKENEHCKNLLKNNEKCHQSILQKQAHKKLLDAEKKGYLAQFEMKHDVQIAVIPDNYKLHICGSNATSAEKDLYRYLWDKVGFSQKSSIGNDKVQESTMESVESNGMNEIGNGSRSRPVCSKQIATSTSTSQVEKQPSSVPVFTLDEDDDDCCVLEEIPKDKQNKRDMQQQGSCGNVSSVGNRKSFERDSPCPEIFTNFEAVQSNTANQMGDKPTKTSTTVGSILHYESPLAGLGLQSKEGLSSIGISDSTFSNPSTLGRSSVNELYSPWNNPQLVPNPFCHTSFNNNCTGLPVIAPSIPPPLNPFVTPEQIPDPAFLRSLPNPVEQQIQNEDSRQVNRASPKVNQTASENCIPSKGRATVNRTKDYINKDEEIDRSNHFQVPSKVVRNLNLFHESLEDDAPLQNNNLNTTEEPGNKIEVITIEDNNEDDEFVRKLQEYENAKKYSVTLLQSEWKMVSEESMRKWNVVNEICSYFGVDLILSKENSTVTVTKGSERERRLAKENIVSWLECQSSNTEYNLLPNGFGTNNSSDENVILSNKGKRMKARPKRFKKSKKSSQFRHQNDQDCNTPSSSSGQSSKSKSGPSNPQARSWRKKKKGSHPAISGIPRHSPKKLSNVNKRGTQKPPSDPIPYKKARYFELNMK